MTRLDFKINRPRIHVRRGISNEFRANYLNYMDKIIVVFYNSNGTFS